MVADAALPVSLWHQRGRMWWTESRPAESGRNALVCDGTDLWSQVSVRTRVHSYGGGAWWPDGADGVYACDDADGRLWHIPAEGEPRPVSPEPAFVHGLRYADGRPHGDGTVCVRENHMVARQSGGEEANEIVWLSGDGASDPEVVATGADFYGWPRPSPDGQRLAWVQWNHPNMPWDQTELWVDGQCAVSGIGSVVEPQWGSDGRLYVVSDHKGWWNLYRLDGADLVPVFEIDAETHRPAWVFDDPSYAVCDDNTVAVAAMRGSLAELWAIPPDGSEPVMLDLPWTSYASVRTAGPHAICAIVASPTQQPTAVRIDVADGSHEVIRPPARAAVDPGYLSNPRPISFPTTGGAEAHGLYYPPAHPSAKAPEGESPRCWCWATAGPPERPAASSSSESSTGPAGASRWWT